MAKVKLDFEPPTGVIESTRDVGLEMKAWVGGWWRDAIAHHVSIKGPPRSKPDEYPRIDTGEFHDSLYYRLYGQNEEFLEITSDAQHADELEQIRPTFSRALDEDWSLFIRELEYLWRSTQ